MGSKLIVRIGRPEETIPTIIRRLGAKDVYCQDESTRVDVQVQRSVSEALEDVGARLRSVWGSTLHHLNELPFALDSLPSNFSSFQKSLESAAVQSPREAPEDLKKVPSTNLEDGKIPTLKVLGFTDEAVSRAFADVHHDSRDAPGGESKAIQILKRTSGPSRHVMSQLSPYLNVGCLAPRLAFHSLTNKSLPATPIRKRKEGSGMNA